MTTFRRTSERESTAREAEHAAIKALRLTAQRRVRDRASPDDVKGAFNTWARTVIELDAAVAERSA